MIFVDTSFFFAFFSEDDANHTRVVEVFEEFEGRNLPEILVTTDHVVFETITLTRYRISHERAVFVGERLYSERMARIHQASFEEQRAAFDPLQEALRLEVLHRGLSELRSHAEARHQRSLGRRLGLHPPRLPRAARAAAAHVTMASPRQLGHSLLARLTARVLLLGQGRAVTRPA